MSRSTTTQNDLAGQSDKWRGAYSLDLYECQIDILSV